jgi:hypothetical protein
VKMSVHGSSSDCLPHLQETHLYHLYVAYGRSVPFYRFPSKGPVVKQEVISSFRWRTLHGSQSVELLCVALLTNRTGTRTITLSDGAADARLERGSPSSGRFYPTRKLCCLRTTRARNRGPGPCGPGTAALTFDTRYIVILNTMPEPFDPPPEQVVP